MDSPGTSYHLKNEKKPSAQLFLLEHEEGTSSTDIGTGGTKRFSAGNSVIIPGHEPKPSPPPSRPPRETEKFRYFQCLYSFLTTVFLTTIVLLCLPVLLLIFLCFGLVPRLFVRFLLKCSNGGRFQLLPVSQGFGSTNGNHHSVMLVIHGRCDIDKIRSHLNGVISSIDTVSGQRKFIHLQKRVDKKFGYLCLENRYSRFDIKNHVKHFDIRKKNVTVDINDIIPYLESTYEEPFENDSCPHWEILVVPKFAYRKEEAKLLPPTSSSKRFYALIFRFHHGVMNWNMFQEMLVEFLGKTSGRVRSPFCPPTKHSCWENFKIFLAILFVGPQTLVKKVWKRWRPFANIHNATTPRISFGLTRTIDCEAFEDIKRRTFTSLASILGNCVRIAARNLLLGQNLELPASLEMTRVFHTMTCGLPGVDTFSVTYNKYRIALERLQGAFHAIERQQGGCSLAGQRVFNKVIILLAGVFPVSVTAWLYKTLLKSDILIEVWPGADEPCKIFGDDMLVDIFGWAGVSGVDADFKATVTTYCGRVRANFTGKQGFIENTTDAQILANEFEEEFKKLAAIAGLYQSRLFLPPVIEVGAGMCG